jgi:DNA modification methylase
MILEDYSEFGYGINIYNEDFRKVMKLLDDESVDMAVTDPPYRITSNGRFDNDILK